MSDHSRRIILADHARRDLLEILEWSLELWGPRQMDAYAATIDLALERLARFPDIGTHSTHLMTGLRRMRVEHHIVFYSHDDEAVRVHRIVHERRQVTPDQFVPDPDE